MGNEDARPTLTDAKGLGGLIANEGFDYQLWDGLARLPYWIANPAFEQVLFEGLEDLEARFFAPHAPSSRLLERYQAKGGNLAPAEVRGVLEAFEQFERAYPAAARVQILVTPRLPPSLKWLGRDPERVRRARPFYAPFSDVAAACDAALLNSMVESYGPTLGRFVFDSVEFVERSYPTRENAMQAFAAAFDRTFQTLELSARAAGGAFEALCGLASRTRGCPLSRECLIRTIEEAIQKSLPVATSFPLQIRSDRTQADERCLEIDASTFSVAEPMYPTPKRWQTDLVAPLQATAKWLRQKGVSRVSLRGSYRLSTALVLGWSLRSATGFELDIPTKDGSWATDDHPNFGDVAPECHVSEPATLHGDCLAVSIGVIRDPTSELAATAGIPPSAVLSIMLPEPIISARSAQAAVARVKAAIESTVTRLRPRSISLYCAGPAAFAVMLGHRWNAFPPTQLHEFIPVRREYVETATLA